MWMVSIEIQTKDGAEKRLYMALLTLRYHEKNNLDIQIPNEVPMVEDNEG